MNRGSNLRRPAHQGKTEGVLLLPFQNSQGGGTPPWYAYGDPLRLPEPSQAGVPFTTGTLQQYVAVNETPRLDALFNLLFHEIDLQKLWRWLCSLGRRSLGEGSAPPQAPDFAR
jgi:hypothetical protein